MGSKECENVAEEICEASEDIVEQDDEDLPSTVDFSKQSSFVMDFESSFTEKDEETPTLLKEASFSPEPEKELSPSPVPEPLKLKSPTPEPVKLRTPTPEPVKEKSPSPEPSKEKKTDKPWIVEIFLED